MPSKNSQISLRPVPMSAEQAAMLVKRLMGSYPSLSLHDPEVYITECVAVLSRHQLSIGEQAVNISRRESPQFIPSVPSVENACVAASRSQPSKSFVSEWDERSRQQFAEREKWCGADLPPPTRYNLFVHADRDGYKTMCEMAKTADQKDYKFENGGIWIPMAWWDDRHGLIGGKLECRRFTVDDLRKMYPPTQIAEGT